jgi:3-hydroxyacyl-[acyl-carrier-protein] dehydratase
MPGVLLIEAMAQATGLLAMESADVPKEAIYYLVGVDKARFKQPVVPGDQVRLEVEVLKHRRDIWVFTAEAKVGDNIAASAEIMCTARNL